MTDQRPGVGGLAFDAEWRLDFQIGFVFEVPLERVEPLLPPTVQASEPVPGVGLLNVIHAHYLPEHLPGWPAFDEVVCSVLVQPDLSVEMPPPRLTFWVVRVEANCQQFVDLKVPTLKMPVHYNPSLRAVIAEDRLSTRVFDESGPIFELGYSGAAPTFREKAFWGQYFARPSQGEAALHHSVWHWSGGLAEQQKRRRDAAQLHEHALFSSLKLKRNTPVTYMQQVSRPNTVVKMQTYRPRCLSEVREQPKESA